MGLEENVKAYADQARQILLARQLKSEETKAGKAYWQGYSTDGRAIVKQDGKFKAVRVVGNASVPKDKVVYIDETNTVDVGYVRKTEARQERFVKKNEPLPLVKRRRPVIIQDEEKEVPVPLTGFYVITYCKRIPGVHSAGVDERIIEGQAAILNQEEIAVSPFPRTQSDNVSYPSSQFTRGMYMERCEAKAGSVLNDTCSASIEGRSVNASVEVQGTQDTQTSDPFFAFDGIGAGNYQTWTYSVDAGTNLPGVVPSQFADVEAISAYRSLPHPVYYYQVVHASESIATKTLNLNTYFSNPVVDHEIWHNFITREGTDCIAYTIFYVRTTGWPDLAVDAFGVGSVQHYWLHVKCNLTKKNTETKITQIGNEFGEPDWSVISDNWIGRAGFPLFNFFRTRDAEKESDFVFDSLSPTTTQPAIDGIFSNAFAGDWISAWSGVSGTTNSVATIKNFLKHSYKEGKYYTGVDTNMPAYWDDADGIIPDIVEYETDETSNFHDGAGGGSNDVGTFISEVANNGTSTNYENYFDGSVDAAPDDIASWTQFNTGYEYYENGISGDKIAGLKSPNVPFSLPEETNAYISSGRWDNTHGDRMGREVWFSYVLPAP